ncbi:hypothetical protein NC651_032848 [Populus alba x Populus x berolinensis]|nr:hypothetical protein NC651_032848 [Populus alba x Populus x berolinensis]
MDSPHAGIKGQTPAYNQSRIVTSNLQSELLIAATQVNQSSNPAESRPFAQHCNRTTSLGREPHPHPNEFLPSRQRAAEGSHHQLSLIRGPLAQTFQQEVLECDTRSQEDEPHV